MSKVSKLSKPYDIREHDITVEIDGPIKVDGKVPSWSLREEAFVLDDLWRYGVQISDDPEVGVMIDLIDLRGTIHLTEVGLAQIIAAVERVKNGRPS